MTKKIVLAMVDETGIRATAPKARAAVWADYSLARRDQIARHIEAERSNHLWMGYFVLPDTEDILAVARRWADNEYRFAVKE